MQADLANTLEAIAQAGPQAFYDGRDRGKDRDCGAGRRRRHDGRRSQGLSRGRTSRRCAAPIAATTSSRCRRPPPAASCWSRCSISSKATISRTRRYAVAVPDDRSDEARLRRPRLFPRRPRRRQGAARAPDLQELRRGMARDHRSGARDARRPTFIRPRRRADGRRQHHAFLGGRQSRQRGRRTPTRSISATASASSPTAPASCSTTSSTISPPSRMRRTPTACSATRPTRPDRASGRCRR